MLLTGHGLFTVSQKSGWTNNAHYSSKRHNVSLLMNDPSKKSDHTAAKIEKFSPASWSTHQQRNDPCTWRWAAKGHVPAAHHWRGYILGAISISRLLGNRHPPRRCRIRSQSISFANISSGMFKTYRPLNLTKATHHFIIYGHLQARQVNHAGPDVWFLRWVPTVWVPLTAVKNNLSSQFPHRPCRRFFHRCIFSSRSQYRHPDWRCIHSFWLWRAADDGLLWV